MMENNLIRLNLKDKIYEIRGQKVMLDFELAEIYGYSTKAFNQQVNRNIAKFDDDFYFQLANDEMLELSRSQNVTSIQTKGVKGGISYNIHAFTEQGIYMLMTVLKGDLATRQSKALIRAFKQMKDYLIANQGQIPSQEFVALSNRVGENTSDIKNLALEQAELKTVITSFIETDKKVEKLLLDGKYVDADFVYASIYNTAKKSVIIIDNYNINIEIKTGKTKNIHDRFIIIDKDTEDEKIYHCGGSSKDAGNKKTVISELKTTDELKKALGI